MEQITLQEVIAAAKELSEEERQLLVQELQTEPYVPTEEERRDLDRALQAVGAGRTVPEGTIRAMLRAR